MRLIGEVQNEARAIYISSLLTQKKIEHRLELKDCSYQVWVLDEDRLDEAQTLFLKASEHSIPTAHLSIKPPSQAQTPPPPKTLYATLFFLCLCVSIFFIQMIQSAPNPDQPTAIDKLLLFDLPPYLDTPPRSESAYWKGFYDWILFTAKTGTGESALGPLFVKIREGQVWRLFSPCLLHGGFLHLLFNMLWLWALCRPIEERIGTLRTVLFTLFIGTCTNCLQYLASGPLFLGYSGIITGLAGFIWMRERIAPWEGYPLNQTTILFLAIFIFAMLALQMISFFAQLLNVLPFVLNIANTAHITGALLGALLGRCSYFAWRSR